MPASASKYQSKSQSQSELVDIRRPRLLAACFSINLLYGGYLAAIGVLIPRIGATFHINSAEQGKIMSAGFIGSVAGVVFCGFLSDRLGRTRVLAYCGALFSTGLVLVGAAKTELFALCAAPLIGAGSAGMQAVASALAADLFPDKRGQVINACQVAFAAGAVVGPGAVYLLLVSGVSWHSVYFGIGGLAGMLAVFLASQGRDRGQKTGSGDRDSVSVSVSDNRGRSGGRRPSVLSRAELPARTEREEGAESLTAANVSRLLLQPAFVCLCAAQVFYAGAEVGYFEWMPTYFDKSLHGPAAAAGVGRVVSLFWIAMTLGRLAMAGLLGRFDSLKVGITFACAGAAGAGLGLCTQRPQLVMAFVAITGLCYGGIYSAILVETGDRFHSGAALGTALGAISAAGSIGSATIPWAVGALAASSGGGSRWRLGLSLAPLSAVVAAALLYSVLLQRRRSNIDLDFEQAVTAGVVVAGEEFGN